MEGPRSPSETEFSHVLDFLDQNLKGNRSWPIQQEYPTALSTQNARNIRIIKDNDEILSHAVLRPILVKTPIGMFKVAAIGSVVTSEKARNQGLSKKVIEDCLAEAKNQNCDFAILWTNLYEFYKRFGFELAGGECSFLINKPLKSIEPQLRIAHGNNVAPEAILKVFNLHTVTSVRTYEDVRKYLQIPQSNVYTAWNANGGLEAYIVEGKGADLQGYVHEWGGPVSAIVQLLNFARTRQKRELTFIAPAHSTNLIRRLNENGFQEVKGYLGMIKIINPTTLLTKVSRAVRFDHGVSDFILEKRDRIFHLGAGGAEFTTDSEGDITRLIFGPHSPQEIHPFETNTLTALGKVLPMPMWIWGWDSV